MKSIPNIINYISDKSKKKIIDASCGSDEMQMAIRRELEELHEGYWQLTAFGLALSGKPVRNLPVPNMRKVLNEKNLKKIKEKLRSFNAKN